MKATPLHQGREKDAATAGRGALSHPCQHPLWPFRQHLERMLRAERHHREHPVNELVRHLRVKQVAHRIHEHPPRLPPVERLLQALGKEFYLATPAPAAGALVPAVRYEGDVTLVSYHPEPPRTLYRVAVAAPLGDRGTAGYRIPGHVRPGYLAHPARSSLTAIARRHRRHVTASSLVVHEAMRRSIARGRLKQRALTAPPGRI